MVGVSDILLNQVPSELTMRERERAREREREIRKPSQQTKQVQGFVVEGHYSRGTP